MKKTVSIKSDDKTCKGRYANLSQVTHTPEEFILDFMTLTDHDGYLVGKFSLSPQRFKRITEVLVDNLEKYEKKFGEVKEN